MQEEGAPIWLLSLKLIARPQEKSMEKDMEGEGRVSGREQGKRGRTNTAAFP